MSTLNGGPGNIVTNGLVFYVDAGNYTSYTSGSLVWNDLANSGYSGSLINNVGYNSNNAGTLTFTSGSGSFIRIVNNANFAPISQDSQSFSVSCWIKGAITAVSENMMIGQDWGSTGGGWNGLRFRQETIHMTLGNNIGNQFADVYGTSLLSTTTYKLYTGTYNGSQVVIYINGVAINTVATTIYPQFNNASKSWTIGGNYQRTSPTNASFFEGNIGSVSFYNRALTAQEVLQNYNSTKGRFGL